jgi:hypothetical protein
VKKWLLNPFEYIAGLKASLIGLAVIILTSAFCILSSTHFDGVIDFHPKAAHGYFLLYLTENIIDVISITLVLYILGRILSKSSVRFIDVFGTQAFARYPLTFAALLAVFSPDMNTILNKTMQNKNIGGAASFSPNELASLIFISVIGLLLIIWTIFLMYKAYSVSCNLNKAKGIVSFACGLIIAEILSKILLKIFAFV